MCPTALPVARRYLGVKSFLMNVAPTRASSPQGSRIYFASDDFCLPTPLPKYVGADEGKRRKSDGDGEEDAARPKAECEGEDVGERNLPEPEYEEIDDRRRPCVTRAVERLRDDH